MPDPGSAAAGAQNASASTDGEYRPADLEAEAKAEIEAAQRSVEQAKADLKTAEKALADARKRAKEL